MGRGPQSKASQRRLTAKERTIKALALREFGLTYDEIGKKLGITTQGAYGAVMRALDQLSKKTMEEAEQVRAIKLERLNRILNAIWTKALKGEMDAIDRVIKIMDRRSRYLGLDALDQSMIDWRVEIVNLIKAGKVTPEQVMAEIGYDLATELFKTAGIQVAPARTDAAGDQ